MYYFINNPNVIFLTNILIPITIYQRTQYFPVKGRKYYSCTNMMYHL